MLELNATIELLVPLANPGRELVDDLHDVAVVVIVIGQLLQVLRVLAAIVGVNGGEPVIAGRSTVDELLDQPIAQLQPRQITSVIVGGTGNVRKIPFQ